MNPQNVIDLAIAYTTEAANLKDYQVPTRKARAGRTYAQMSIEFGGFKPLTVADAIDMAKGLKVEYEEADTNDPNDYYWALVPEYDTYKKAKIVLKRIGTTDGEIILPEEKRHDRPLKISRGDADIVRRRNRKALIAKIRNYEAQIREGRRRLAGQINNGDKVYMEAEAIELKRIIENMNEDLDDFLNDIAVPF